MSENAYFATAARGLEPLLVTELISFGAQEVVELAAGGRHTCVRYAGGKIACWGHNSSGQLGIGRDPLLNALEVAGDASKSVPGLWAANSDGRIKQNVGTINNALESLGRVRLVSYEYTDAYRERHPGVESRRHLNVIAQEFAEVFPDYVKGSGEQLPDGSEILQVDAWPLTVYSAAAVQELHAETRAKDEEIAELKARVDALESKLDRIIKDEAIINH